MWQLAPVYPDIKIRFSNNFHFIVSVEMRKNESKNIKIVNARYHLILA